MSEPDDFEIRIAAYPGLTTKLPEFIRDEHGNLVLDENGQPKRYKGAVVSLPDESRESPK